MPSEPANNLISYLTDVMKRPLGPEEVLKCEEIVINVFPNAALNWAKRWTKSHVERGKNLTIDHYYKPLLNGIIPQAMKRKGETIFRFNSDNKRSVYATMHSYIGTGFTYAALNIIIWLCEFATPQEVETAVQVAQYHGVINHAYVRAIIVGNRRKAAAQLAAHDKRFTKITNDPPEVLTGVPNVKPLQDAWTARLKKAIAAQEERTVTDAARRKLSL